jgi:prophage tail gpP-like protein
MEMEEMQKQIESMMLTPKGIVENIDKKLEEKMEQITHNILSKYAKNNGLVKYEYPDGFYVFGKPDSQELADKKHEEWLERQ